MRPVVLGDGFAALVEIAGDFQFVPDAGDAGRIFHRLAVVGHIAFAVEVALANEVRRESEVARDAIENVFDHDHALGAAEAAEGGLGGLVGLADPAGGVEGGDEVGVVAVEEGAPEDGVGEVEAPAAVRVELQFDAAEASIVFEAGAEFREEGVALAGERHVEPAWQAHTNGALGFPRAQGCDGRPRIGLDFFTAERAAHAEALHGNEVARDAENPRDDFLGFAGVLGGGIDEDAAGVIEP